MQAGDDDGTHLILITGTLNRIITTFPEDSVHGQVRRCGVDGLLCLGEVGLVSGCGI